MTLPIDSINYMFGKPGRAGEVFGRGLPLADPVYDFRRLFLPHVWLPACFPKPVRADYSWFPLPDLIPFIQ
jgi:hypothetical protein